MPRKTCVRTALALLGGFAAALSWLHAGLFAHEAPFDAIPWIAASIACAAIGLRRWITPPADLPPGMRGMAFSPRQLLGVLALGLGILAALHGPTLPLPFLNEEDLFHLAVVRRPDRVGTGVALAEALAYLGSHPATIIQSLVFVPWFFLEAIGGDAPWVYRLLGLVLHGGMSVLTVCTARLLGLGRTAALGAGLLALVAAVSRPVVRDPTGLPELMAGVIYLGLLLSWIPRLEGRATGRAATVWAFALLPAAMLTKPILASLPPVAIALVLLRGRVTVPGPGRRIAVRALPLIMISVVQLALVAWQFQIDPTSGRDHPSHPEAEYGLIAEAATPVHLAAALAADLPRTLVFPAWDHAPQAHWSGAVAAGLALLALLGLSSGREVMEPVVGGLILTLGAALPGLAFTGDEGPVNAHLLYTATAGGAITAAAWVASLPRRRAICAALLLSAWCGTALTLHTSGLRTERAEARRLAQGQLAFDRLDEGFAVETPVQLVSGSDGATNRWRHLVLSRHARGLGPRGAYRIETGVTLHEYGGEEETTAAPPDTHAPVLAWVDGRVTSLDGRSSAPDDIPRVPTGTPVSCGGEILAEIAAVGRLCAGDHAQVLHPVERLLAEM